jgi:hypothetical protein
MKTKEPPSFQACVKSLHRRIAGVRLRRTVVRKTAGITSALALLAGVFTAEAVLDALVDLPWVARALIFACNLAGSSYLLWRDSIQPFRERLNDDDIALIIEHAMPVFKTRFIASIQLARHSSGDGPQSVVRALLAETAATAAKLNFNYVIKTKRMKRALLAAVAVAAISAALIHAGGSASLLLFKRAMLATSPLPHKTNILTITGDQKIGVGEDFKLAVTAGGVIPANGQVTVTTASGSSQQFTLDRDPGHPGAFNAVIHSQQASFSYQVKLNDDTSQTYHVVILQRPAAAEVACEQIYPAYVRLPPRKLSTGDLTILAGSSLKISARASIPVKRASLQLAGTDKEIPMVINSGDQKGLSGEIPIPAKDLTGFSIRLVSTEGAESGEAAIYRIDLVQDQPPTVKITYPALREELATEKAKLLVAFEATDDFGIARVELHYTIDGGAEKIVPFDLGGRTDRTVTRHYSWELGKFEPPLSVGNVIEFWIAVADTNDVTGPGVGTTEHYQTKIVSADEKRLDLANRIQDTITAVKEVTGSEEQLNKTLGEGISAKPKEP